MNGVARVGWLLLLLVAAGLGRPSPSAARERSDAATPAYNAAVALQNKGQYQRAAQQWADFITKHQADPRLDRAYHYLGVCYLHCNQLEAARQCFEIVLKNYPKCELLESTCLHLGVVQLKLAQAGKVEMFDAAAATFATLIEKYPQGPYLAQALLGRGDCLYHRGKKEEAAELYARLVEKFPADKLLADALYALGVTREELGRPGEAAAAYNAFLKKFPDHALAGEVTLRRGETSFSLGRYPAAADWFAAAARKDFPLADHALMRQAASLAQAKDYARAAAVYAAVPAKYPQSRYAAAASLPSGKCYYLAGDYAQARKMLEKSLAAGDPSAAEAIHWIARSWLKEGRPAEALTLLEKPPPCARAATQTPQWQMDRADAIYDLAARRGEAAALYAALAEAHPDDPLAPRALYMAGLAALGTDDAPAALKHANSFLAAYPGHALAAEVAHVAAEAGLQVGESAYQAGDFRAAAAAYQAAADRAGRSATGQQAAYKLGWACYHLGDADRALAAFRRQRAGWPAGPLAADARFMEAECLFQQKKYAEALAACEAAKGPSSKDFEALGLLRRGQAAGHLKQWDKSVPWLTQCVRQFPDSPYALEALYQQGWAQQNLGKPDQAVALYEMVAAKTNREVAARAQFLIGEIQFQQKKYADALKSFFKVAYGYGYPQWQAEASYEAARCFEALRQPAQAAKQYRELIEKYPRSDKVPPAKKRLAQLRP